MQQIRQKRFALSRSKTGCVSEARSALATGGWGPPGAWCLWICTLVIDPFSWEWQVGEKTEGYSTKQLKERVNEWRHRGGDDASRAPLPAYTKMLFCGYATLRHRTVINVS